MPIDGLGTAVVSEAVNERVFGSDLLQMARPTHMDSLVKKDIEGHNIYAEVKWVKEE